MHTPADDVTLRPLRPDDGAAALDLVRQCEAAVHGEPETELEELLGQWSTLDLEQDGWLALDGGGAPVGYAAAFGERDRFTLDVYARRDAPHGLADRLLEMCERRAAARQHAAHGGVAAAAVMYIPQGDGRGEDLAARHGYQVEKIHLRMEIELEAPPPEPSWPPGYSLRTFVPGQDDRMVHAFVQRAFDRPGRTPQPFGEWRGFMMRADPFVRDLWFLLFDGEALAGTALCFDYPPHGWVRELAVDPARRGRGLGAALLGHAFAVFYARGHRRVALGVEARNEEALTLYARVGMQCVRRYNEYVRLLERAPGAARAG